MHMIEEKWERKMKNQSTFPLPVPLTRTGKIYHYVLPNANKDGVLKYTNIKRIIAQIKSVAV